MPKTGLNGTEFRMNPRALGRMMSSYAVWLGQLPLVTAGAGCKNHHTEALLIQSTELQICSQIHHKSTKGMKK